MEEAYQCPNCGLPFPNDVIYQQCGYRFARSGAGIRTSKLKLCVIAVAILTALGIGIFLVGVPSEIQLTGNDLGQLTKTGECRECDLSEADLTGANLFGAGLDDAILIRAHMAGANLTGADLRLTNLTGVIGADFTGALNVPEKYLKD